MMTALAQREFQSRPVGDWKSRRLSHVHHIRDDRLVFDADESMARESSWIVPWHDPEKTEVQLMKFCWNSLDRISDYIEAWQTPDYCDRRSYSLPVSESFQIAAREYSTITIDPDIMSGAPCIAGTRIPVYMILDAIGNYGSPEGVLEAYPKLTLAQVRDAIGFAKIALECPLADDEP